jgi:hypothetical protein
MLDMQLVRRQRSSADRSKKKGLVCAESDPALIVGKLTVMIGQPLK